VMTIIPFFFLNGAGKARLNTFLELTLKSLNVLAMVVLFQFFDVDGILYGLIISVAVFIPLQQAIIQRKVLDQQVSVRTPLVVLPAGLMAFFVLGTFAWWKLILPVLALLAVRWIFAEAFPSRITGRHT
ncbi:MAG: hypothetical protein AAGB22_06180, partial [Bacteroidota bacterium]